MNAIWQRGALIAGIAITLILVGGVAFTLHQRGQCVAGAGLWYDSLPSGRLGRDPHQVDWSAARGACGWAARLGGSGLHQALHARALARLPLDDSDADAARRAFSERAARVDAILFRALPDYPYAVFDAGAGLLASYSELMLIDPANAETVAAIPPASATDAAIAMLQERVPIERAAYQELLARARRGDQAAAILLALKGDSPTLSYSSFAKGLHQTALAVTAQAPTEDETIARLRAAPGAADHFRRIGEGLAAIAALPDLPRPEPGELLALNLTAARAGNPAAQFVAAESSSGESAPPLSDADRVRFLSNGAERGLAPAQHRLAAMHLAAARSGETPAAFRQAGVTPSREAALHLLRAADAQRFKPATIALADGYLQGWFGAPDLDAALAHYEKAVD